MTKPSTPDVWASLKAFGFQPTAAQQAQGFDYIASVRPSTGAPITDDHDWPLKQITTALKWVMDQFPDGGIKYGCPLVGSLIHWPIQQMPQEIWTDCGMTFIPYIGQAFDPVKYPLLKMLHPSGVLPADMRSMVAKGFDSGRGLDAGRAIMSFQPGSLIYGDDDWASGAMALAGLNVGNRAWSSYGIANPSNYPQAKAGTMSTTTSSGGAAVNFNAAGVAQVDSIAWNTIVRAS